MDPLGFRLRVQAPSAESAEHSAIALVKVVTPDFFETLGIDIAAGRSLTAADDENAPSVAVVNEAFATSILRYANGGPIGRVVESALGSLEIVGVSANLTPHPTAAPQPTMFVPFRQVPVAGSVLIVRATNDPLALIPAVRDLIWDLDSSIPLNQIATLEQAVTRSVASPRFTMLLLILFASLAVSLAAIGVYGVQAYSVGQRTRELGLRQALGAARTSVLLIVVREGMTLAVSGIALGLLVAVALTRFLRPLLYAVSPTDPVTFGAVSVILAVVSIVACVVPARRATRIDPLEALRSD